MRRWLGSVVMVVIGCGADGNVVPDAPRADASPDAIGLSIYEAYGRAWGEPEVAARDRLLAYSASDGIVVVEPTRELTSRQAVSNAAGAFLAQVPGGSIPLTSNVREHAARAWFTWDVLDGQGTKLETGTDLMMLAADGKIDRVHSFFGALPAPGAHDTVQQAFLDAWNETDATARLVDLMSSVTDDVRFSMDGEATPIVGRAALSDTIAAVIALAPGRTTETTSGYLTVPGAWYATWRDVAADGTTVIGTGVTFTRLATDGRIAEAAVFFGLTP